MITKKIVLPTVKITEENHIHPLDVGRMLQSYIQAIGLFRISDCLFIAFSGKSIVQNQCCMDHGDYPTGLKEKRQQYDDSKLS